MLNLESREEVGKPLSREVARSGSRFLKGHSGSWIDYKARRVEAGELAGDCCMIQVRDGEGLDQAFPVEMEKSGQAVMTF